MRDLHVCMQHLASIIYDLGLACFDHDRKNTFVVFFSFQDRTNVKKQDYTMNKYLILLLILSTLKVVQLMFYASCTPGRHFDDITVMSHEKSPVNQICKLIYSIHLTCVQNIPI